MKGIKILLADDHAIVAEGLMKLLESEFESVEMVGDGRALLEAARRFKPNLIVADISMPLLNGIDAMRLLKKEGLAPKVIFLTMHREPQLAAEAFRAGASGYLLKQAAGEELITAIHEILNGHSYVTPLIAQDVLSLLMETSRQPSAMATELTPRQREVLQLIAEGRTMKEVGTILNISTRTAESHKYEIMHALGVKTTAELIQYAIRIGVISIDQVITTRKNTAANPK